MPTFTYNFGAGSVLNVVTNGLTTDTSGGASHGAGYDVTSITGTFLGYTITGEVGSGGYEGFNSNEGAVIDNIIFNGDANGIFGSVSGIDGEGLGFTIDLGGGVVGYVNLYGNAGGSPPFYYQTTINGVASNAALNGSFNSVTTDAPCYLEGTMVLTDRGEVAVENLHVGDLVVTASGEHRPIRWLGHRRVHGRSHPRPQEVMPIRISAHALGANKPSRDLYVSPGHSISIDVIDAVLIPAGSLVNGSTVVQVEVDTVTYWHVELDSHDLLLAENLPAESYLEMGNRDFFAERGVVNLIAYPDAPDRTHADFCLPFHAEGPLVDVVRSQLRARAKSLGWVLEQESLGDLHLLVDGVRVEPAVRGLTARFCVPASAQDVWLVSRTSRPCDISDSNDERDLGVCLRGLTIDDGFNAARQIDLADPLLCIGFHALEDGIQRWTAGRARLPAALWADCPDSFYLRLDLTRPALQRWVNAQVTTVSEATESVNAEAPALALSA